MDRTVNQQFGKQAFDQAEKLFKDARVPENVQAMAQQSLAASKDFYAKTAAAAQDGAKVMTEIADTAWGSTKLLNEKIVQKPDGKHRGRLQCSASDGHGQVAARNRQVAKRIRPEACRAGKRADQGILRSVDPGHATSVREGPSRGRQVLQAHILSSNPSTAVETATALVAVFLFCTHDRLGASLQIRLACARVPQETVRRRLACYPRRLGQQVFRYPKV
jgi:hypothetical protein